MEDKKIILIAVIGAIFGAFAIGTERAVGFLILVGIGGAIWLFHTHKKQYDLTKNDHLNGNYKFKINCLSKLGEVYAVGQYRGFADGNFDLEKLYIDGSEKDIRHDISYSEWSEVKDEIRNYFVRLRK